MSEPAPALPRPVRAWPILALALIYWGVQIAVSLSDIATFPRFLTKSLGALAFLVLFLIVWLSNGTLSWRTRLVGLVLLFGGAGLSFALADRSFDPISYLMMTVPWVLSALALWHFEGRRIALMAAVILLGFLFFDLFRWNGIDGHLDSSLSLRWQKTPEQDFLAMKSAPAAVAAQPTHPWTPHPGDWPEFRGPERDGVVRGIRIATSWKDAPPQKVWRQRVGPGWSSLIYVDGFLVTQEQRGESEMVVCYEAASGHEVWASKAPARFTEGISGAGPRGTPTFWNGRLYALGATGILSCLEASSGKTIWSRDVAKEAQATAPIWGFSASPLVVDGKVVVFAGKLQAWDAGDGKPVWSREGGKDSYASAQLVSIQGKAQIVFADTKGLVGLSIADGKVLWERPNPDPAAIPYIQPHPLEDGVLVVASGLGLGQIRLREKDGAWSVEELWTTKKFRPSFNDFVIRGAHVYGLDEGVLSCVDLKTGERVWKSGRYGSGQLALLAEQGWLLIVSEKGELALVEAKPEEPGEVFRFPAITGKTWNHPTIVQDCVYLRNGEEMACYRLPGFQKP